MLLNIVLYCCFHLLDLYLTRVHWNVFMEGVLAEMAAQFMLYKPTQNQHTQQRDKENWGKTYKKEGSIIGTPFTEKTAYYKQPNMPISGSKTLLTFSLKSFRVTNVCNFRAFVDHCEQMELPTWRFLFLSSVWTLGTHSPESNRLQFDFDDVRKCGEEQHAFSCETQRWL